MMSSIEVAGDFQKGLVPGLNSVNAEDAPSTGPEVLAYGL